MATLAHLETALSCMHQNDPRDYIVLETGKCKPWQYPTIAAAIRRGYRVEKIPGTVDYRIWPK
jgi:hypothetical protein